MRIAFIHPKFPSAEGTGATHSATQIVNGLAEAGHDISVYCSRIPEENTVMSKLELRHLAGNSRHPHTQMRLNREITARLGELREFDIVHSYLMQLMPSVSKIGKESDVGVVVTLNAYSGTCAKNDLRYLNRERCQNKSTFKCLNCITKTGFGSDHGYLYHTMSKLFSLQLIKEGESRLEHIDAFQALSPNVMEAYTEFGYDGGKIKVIPNILDTRFDTKHETNFEAPFRFLYVGGLRKSKGIDRIVDVFSRISQRSSKSVYLTIVGDGELRKMLHQQVKESSLSELIEIKGQVPYGELPAIYASHDVFLYPGRWNEPFGRVFLESMAAGTPIVATDVGNVSEIVGEAGVIAAQDATSLVESSISVLDNQTLRDHSKEGKRRANTYRASKIIPQFESLYSQIV